MPLLCSCCQQSEGLPTGIIHLIAFASRHPEMYGKITLQTVHEIGEKTPLIVDLKPSGDDYMADFSQRGRNHRSVSEA